MIVTAEELEAIKRHAVDEYPREACGVILVRGTERRLLRCHNDQDELHARDPARHPRDARTAYSISLEGFRQIDKLESEGFRIRTFYHSHIDAGAYFSETDKRHAAPPPRGEPLYPDATYLVVSVVDRRVEATGTFGWDPTERDFLPLPFGEP